MPLLSRLLGILGGLLASKTLLDPTTSQQPQPTTTSKPSTSVSGSLLSAAAREIVPPLSGMLALGGVGRAIKSIPTIVKETPKVISTIGTILGLTSPSPKEPEAREVPISGQVQPAGIKTAERTTLTPPPAQTPKAEPTRVSGSVLTASLPTQTTPTITAREPAPTPPIRTVETLTPPAPPSVMAEAPRIGGGGILTGAPIPTGAGIIPTPPTPARPEEARPISEIIQRLIAEEAGRKIAELPLPEAIEERAKPPRPRRLEEVLGELLTR